MVKETRGNTKNDGFPTIVDYNTSIEDLLKGRHYDRVLPEINSNNFPSKKGGKERIIARVFELKQRPIFGSPCFERELCSIVKKGYEPVDLRELLTVFNQHKNIKALPLILALGSVIEIYDDLKSPFIQEHCSYGRSVGLEDV